MYKINHINISKIKVNNINELNNFLQNKLILNKTEEKGYSMAVYNPGRAEGRD